MTWFAKISPDEAANDHDHYKMVLFNDSKAALVLWRGKTFDEALALLQEFQVNNGISDQEGAQTIDITELM